MALSFFCTIVWIWIAAAIVLVPLQLKVTAPYGRHVRAGWGPAMPYRWGWILMEIVSPIVFCWFVFAGGQEMSLVTWVIVALWVGHYFNRTMIYPFRAKMGGKSIPLSIVASAAFFNLVNGWVNGYYLGTLTEPRTDDWFFTPQFIIGIALFLTGMGINIWTDHRLSKLRKAGETGYKIPRGGLFEFISCPNHFGEIIEWTGFAILCWSLPAASFAVWTAANLIPRALSHHRWYRSNFPDYPKDRKAVIPKML